MLDKQLIQQAETIEGLTTLLHDGLAWPIDEEEPFLYEPEIAEGIKFDGGEVNVRSLIPAGVDDEKLILHVEFPKPYLRRDLRDLLTSLRKGARELPHLATRTGVRDTVFIVTVADSDGTYTDTRFVLFTENPGRQPAIKSFGWRKELIGRTVITHNLENLRWERRLNWESAWNVTQVNKDFYNRVLEVRNTLVSATSNAEDLKHANLFVQLILNRLLFISFAERMGWMWTPDGNRDYLFSLYNNYKNQVGNEQAPADLIPNTFCGLLGLLSEYLDEEEGIIEGDPLYPILGNVPYLNGGLFSKDPQIEVNGITIADEAFEELFNEKTGLFRTFNFTVMESTPLDQEVAVDPEMLGTIFERLIIREERHKSGTYYTPREIVDFMVSEALVNYLVEQNLPEVKAKLLIYQNKVEFEEIAFKPSELQLALDALNRVKAVDPACGSGAYLLGLLQKIFDATDRLEVSQRKGRETSADDPEGHHHLYTRKLEILRNSIFGVDLSDMSIPIARLRLWLSLAVENNGLKPDPLPNLDFRILQGDALCGPATPTGGQMGMYEESLRQLATPFKNKKAEFMGANKTQRPMIQAEIDKIKDEIAHWLDLAGARNIYSDLFKLSTRPFDWLLEFAEVFFPEQTNTMQLQMAGFDIVLANPPYVSAMQASESLDSKYRSALKKPYKSAVKSYDIAILFMERAVTLLSNNGILVFITPNKYLSAPYGEGIRRLLVSHGSIAFMMDLSMLRIFKEVSVYPVVTGFKKNCPQGQVASMSPKVDEDEVIIGFETTLLDGALLQLLPEFIWGFLLGSGSGLIKVLLTGESLSDYFRINATTTANEAEELSQHLAEHGISGSTFKVVNTGTIDARHSLWGSKQMLNARRNYKSPVIPKQVCGRQIELYGSKKLLFAKLANRCEAFLDEHGEYSALNVNCAHHPLKDLTLEYLECYVHTSVFHYLYTQFFGALRMSGGYLQFQAPQLRVIPLVKLSNESIGEVLRLRKQLINCKEIADELKLLLKIDSIFADHFQITSAERRQIRAIDPLKSHYRKRIEGQTKNSDFESYWLSSSGDETYDQWRTRVDAEANTIVGETREIIKKGEGNKTEFKESLEAPDLTHPSIANAPENQRNQKIADSRKAITHSALKTVCGFLNSSGGTLLIGVKDNGDILGLARDYADMKIDNYDKWALKLHTYLRNHLSPFNPGWLDSQEVVLDGKPICRIDISKATKPVYLDNKLYIRNGHETIELTGRSHQDWLDDFKLEDIDE